MSDGDESTRQDPADPTYLGCEDRIEAARMVAIIGIGMCRALSDGTVSPAYACHRLFGPALLSWVRKLNVDTMLVDAIHLATELEDVADIIPDNLPRSILDVEQRLISVLRSHMQAQATGESWLERIKRPAVDEIGSDNED